MRAALVLLLFLCSSLAAAQPGPDAFARKLWQEGDHYRAVSQFKSLSLVHAELYWSSNLPYLHLMSLEALAQRREGIQLGQKIFAPTATLPPDPWRKQAAAAYGRLLLRQGQITLAKEHWELYVSGRPEPGLLLPSQLPGRIDPEEAALKSAWIPGWGFLASEEYSKAAVSLGLNLIFAYGIWQSLEQGHPAMAGLLFFFEWGWYQGGKRASAESARQWNARLLSQAHRTWLAEQENSLGIKRLTP